MGNKDEIMNEFRMNIPIISNLTLTWVFTEVYYNCKICMAKNIFQIVFIDVISCCSTGVFLDIAICPTCISFVLEIGNVQCNNLRCTQTGRTSSCADTLLFLSCWTAPPTFPYSRLPSWTTAPCGHPSNQSRVCVHVHTHAYTHSHAYIHREREREQNKATYS